MLCFEILASQPENSNLKEKGGKALSCLKLDLYTMCNPLTMYVPQTFQALVYENVRYTQFAFIGGTFASAPDLREISPTDFWH